MSPDRLDAVVVGSGPNGLAAAVALAREGRTVRVLEAADRPGGGTRSAELTLPGFVHDICSTAFPLAAGSPFLRDLGLEAEGLAWVHPEAPCAHPLDGGEAALLERDVDRTADGLGVDGAAWGDTFGPLVDEWRALFEDLLGPLARWPSAPLMTARAGLLALRSGRGLARRFRGPRARALWAGIAAHGMLPFDRALGAGAGIVLAVAGHAVGWPFARGGSSAIADALVSRLEALGGELVLGRRVQRPADVPPCRAVLLDVAPRDVLTIAGPVLPPRYRRRLAGWRYGPSAFKVDWALDGPVPWAAPECARAGTLHLGGTLEEIAGAERDVWAGHLPERPFVLLVQPAGFDPTRAPPGRHTAWAYAHVPPGWTGDAVGRIEAQVERFAPGFGERILARAVHAPGGLAQIEPNCVDGSIGGGVQDLGQTFARPRVLAPYRIPLRPGTPWDAAFLCSASTPPGAGVHGMCGWHAARAALRALAAERSPEGRS